MDAATYAVVLALLAGTLRAAELWRASIGVAVVNVVVLNALAEGRGKNLREVLRGSGSAPYLDAAAAIGQAAFELGASESPEDTIRERLEQEARVAVIAASGRLRKHAWLDAVALAAIVFAGLNAVMNASASEVESIGLVAATLLWFANMRGARSIMTRVYSGATALVDSLREGLLNTG